MKSNGKLKHRKNSEKNGKNKQPKENKNEKIEPEKIKSTITDNKNEEKLKYGALPTFSYQRVFTRATIILCVLFIVWYTSKEKHETSLGTRKQFLQHRGQGFQCGASFQQEVDKYPGCAPKQCGRYISDILVTNSEADTLLRLARNGIALGSAEGGASILDLHSGALSHGKTFINIYSLESAQKLFSSTELAVYKVVKTKIQHAIAHNFGIDVEKLHLTHPTFFSKLTNKEPKTIHDEYWHPHIDKKTYESFHYTSLLYLSDYEVDFTGGRLIFMDPQVNVTLEPKKGRIAMFSSGEENVHLVERVQSGTRYAITVAFSCDSSKAVPDPGHIRKHTANGNRS